MTNSHSDPKPLAEVVPIHGGDPVAYDAEQARADERAVYLASVFAQLPAHLRRCGVGDHHVREIVAGIDRDLDPVRQRDEWWVSGEKFLLLVGAAGTGKTLLACDLFQRVTKRGGYEYIGEVSEWDSKGARIVKVDELARVGFWGPERELLVDATKRRLLVIDDLGTEAVTDPWRANLFGLIDRRWQDGLRTVITTNLKPEALRDRYDARVYDRIRSTGRVVYLGDKSLRGRS